MNLENESCIVEDGVLVKWKRYSSHAAIPDGVKEIGKEAFLNMVSVKYVLLPDSVDVIREHAFDGCSSLKNIEFSTNLKYIADGAFADCSEINELFFPDSLERIGWTAFDSCTSLEVVHLGKNVKTIENSAFLSTAIKTVDYRGTLFDWNNVGFPNEKANPLNGGAELLINGEAVKELAFDRKETAINKFAFSGCTSLEKAVIPKSVRRIDESAFSNCTALKEVFIPDAVSKLDKTAFYGDKGVKLSMKRSLFDKAGYITCPACREFLSMYSSDKCCNKCGLTFELRD